MMSGKRTTKVRVGVRVRPLASKEIQQGGKESLLVQAPSISIGNNKRFTYDAVFDSRVDQETMYSAVSGSLLDSFIEGYNATVSRASVGIQISVPCGFSKSLVHHILDSSIWADWVGKDVSTS